MSAKLCKYTYFYIHDHLGSTSLVLDTDGNISQSVTYISYGEIFVEERNGAWNSPYLFNSKELDEETGLCYYGARYLNPTNAVWMSVDPKFEDFAGITAYGYCLGNPIKLVDSDGELPILPILWAIYEFGSTAYDIYQTGKTLADGNASTEEKVVAFAGTTTGLFMPGGGYGTAGKVAVKVADKAVDASKIATKVDDGVKAVENVNINVTPVNEKTYQTYTKLNPKTGEVYSGRTSGNGIPEENILKRDKNHHMNKFGFGPAILDKSSSNKNAIRRVQEQILINNNGGAKSFWGKFWQ